MGGRANAGGGIGTAPAWVPPDTKEQMRGNLQRFSDAQLDTMGRTVYSVVSRFEGTAGVPAGREFSPAVDNLGTHLGSMTPLRSGAEARKRLDYIQEDIRFAVQTLRRASARAVSPSLNHHVTALGRAARSLRPFLADDKIDSPEARILMGRVGLLGKQVGTRLRDAFFAIKDQQDELRRRG